MEASNYREPIPLELTSFRELWRYREMIRKQADTLGEQTCLADEQAARGVLALYDYVTEIDQRIMDKDAEKPSEVLFHARVLAYRLALPPSAQKDQAELAGKLVAELERFVS